MEQTLSMQLNCSESMMAMFLSTFLYLCNKEEESAFNQVKKIVMEVEGARSRRAYQFSHHLMFLLEPSLLLLPPDDLAIVSYLWRFMTHDPSSSMIRFLTKQRGFWPSAFDGPGIQQPLVLNSTTSGLNNPIHLDKLRNAFIVFNDGIHLHQLKISGVFLKCQTYGYYGRKIRWRPSQGFTIVDSAGNPVLIDIAGTRISNIQRPTFDIEAFCHINRFDKTIIQVREHGKIVKADNNKVFLEWLMPGSGKKVTIREDKNLVPACKFCDGPLLSKSDMVADDEWKLPLCPYCNKPMEVTWRDARTIAMEFDHDPNDWAQFSRKAGMSRALVDTMPVRHNGVLRPLAYKRGAIDSFIQAFVLASPNLTIGPVCMELAHDSRNTYFYFYQNRISGMVPGTPVVKWPNTFVSATPSQIITRTEVDAKKKELAEARAKKALVKSLKASPSIEIPTLIEHGIPFPVAKTLSKTYLHLESTDRDINWATFTASLRRGNGDKIPQIAVDTGGKRKVQCTLDKVVIESGGLSNLMQMIQKSAKEYFSSVKFFVIESTVQYQDGLVHQYLKPVLNEPGQPTSIPKSGRKVHACAACDAMLLRFSFNWVFQNDDFKLDTCPYCKAPLKTIERRPKLVAVFLDPDAKGCVITGTNNQIGAIYNGVPVKLTVKVKSMMHFLQNYEHLFANNVIGPLDLQFSTRPKSSLVYLRDSKFSQFERGVEWRPVVLYPEDLIAF
nr:hypothetical protein [Candidatus Sigynarchaeum springense]